DRIVRLASVTQSTAVGEVSYPDFDDLQKRATSFESLATTRNKGAAVDTHNGGQSRITLVLVVSGDFFRMLRLQPVLGRTFLPEEDRTRDRDAVAMISYGMWQRDFGGSRDVIGKTVRINRTEFTIVGVVPASFTGVSSMVQPELYAPHMMLQAFDDEYSLADRSRGSVDVYGRLKPGVTVQDARMEVARIAAQLEQENPGTNRGKSMGVYTQTGYAIAEDPEGFTAAILLLLIGVLVLGI